MAGAVQHGASTLPDEAFHHFREATAEVHLATAFQNMIYDSKYFPASLREMIYDYVRKDLIVEKGAKDTEERFIYKRARRVLAHSRRTCGTYRPMS